MALTAGIFGAIVIFGGILGGYIFTDAVTLTESNWKLFFLYRFLLHLLGISPFIVLSIFIAERKIIAVSLSLILLCLMNLSPILDLIKGPITLTEPKISSVFHERYANPASDVDFSTIKEKYTRLSNKDVFFDITQTEWEKATQNCNKKSPYLFTGLYHMDKLLSWKCGPNR